MLPSQHATRALALVVLLVAVLVAACSAETPTATSPNPTIPLGSPTTSASTGLPTLTPGVTAAPTAAASPTETATAAPTSGPSIPASAEPTPSPTEPPAESPTAEPTETSAPLSAEPCASGGAWIGTQSYGLVCLDAGGWHAYTKASEVLRSDQLQDIVSCPDQRVWIATTLGLLVTDGEQWQDRSDAVESKSLSSLACDPQGGIWFGYYGGVGHLDATGTVTWYGAADMGTGKYVDQVKDIALADDGRLWVVTANSVAVLKGTRWTVYEQGHGFSKLYYFETIAVDHDGHPWAGMTDGLVTLAGSTWTSHTDRDLFQPQAIVVDTSNHVWVATYSRGISVWNGRTWTTYNRTTSGIPSDYTHSVATDSRGRIWVGTEWGLAVLTGTKWTAYQMHTSGLLDNETGVIAVVERGPTLPALLTKKTGAISASVVESGAPGKKLAVEVCVEYLGFSFSGDTPCSGQPYLKRGETAADGTFKISGLHVGRYSMAIQRADGTWVRLTDQFRIGDRETLVTEGQTTDLGELDITKKS